VVNAGVRQGGVLSPYLFAVYIDQLIRALETSGHGCVVHGVYLGCIVYADDICLMSHSSCSMQSMLDICSSEIAELHLNFTCKKSVTLLIGPRYNFDCAPFYLDGNVLQSVTRVRYLGIFIISSRRMVCSFEHIRLKFYSTFNAIYRRSKSADSELVTVELIRSFCLPLITQALEALNLRATDYLMLDNLLNYSLAKIFNISHDRVVLHDIRLYLGIPSVKALCMVRHMKFVRKAADIKNVAIQTALLILQNELGSMCNSVNVDIDCSYGAFYYAVNSCYL
jgi:Reverse transcriptase (RNA-dependent DNA polymerase)